MPSTYDKSTAEDLCKSIRMLKGRHRLLNDDALFMDYAARRRLSPAKVEHNPNDGGDSDKYDGMPALCRLYPIGEHQQDTSQN